MLYEVTKLSGKCSHAWQVSHVEGAYPRDVPQVLCRSGHKFLCDLNVVIKLLNSVASVLIHGEFLTWLVLIHVMFHRSYTVHCKRTILREDTSITHM